MTTDQNTNRWSAANFSLTTERLVLRAYESTDWARVHIYGSDPEFSKYEVWGPNTTTEESFNFVTRMIELAKLTPRYKFELAVCLKDSGLLIGGCGLRKETELSHIGSLGWAINPEFQNKGFATEAARALIDFGFNDLKLSVIYATCDTRNAASYKVMEKSGMKKVGFIKGTQEIKGYVRDTFRYEILTFL